MEKSLSWSVFSDVLSVLLLVVLAVAMLRSMQSLKEVIAHAQRNDGDDELIRKNLARLSMNRFVVVLTIGTIAVKTALILGAILDFDSIDKRGLLDDSVVQYIDVQ